MCVFKILYPKSSIPSNQSNGKHFMFGALKDGADTTSQIFNKITAFSEL